jgi:arylsulfatase A-like enzyme
MHGKNILLIMTDQQRADTLSCNDSHGLCRTPHLDELASESVVFENAYTSSAVCSPARASLQTGQQPSRHGIESNTRCPGCRVHDLPDSPHLLSKRLSDAGYNCGYTGKWHLGFERSGNDADTAPFPSWYSKAGNSLPTTRGYIGDDFAGHGSGGYGYSEFKDYLKSRGTEFIVENEFEEHEGSRFMHTCWGEVTSPIESTNEYYLVERTIHHLEQFRKEDKPFYFQLNFWGPHAPFYAPKEYLDWYRDVSIPPWPNFADTLDGKPKVHDAWRRFDKPWEFFETSLQYYYGFMSSIDGQVGRLIAYLKESGLYNDTIIVFTADHGDSQGCHAGLENKAIHMYEEIMKIPMIVKTAGGGGGAATKALVNTCDVYSTVLELAGCEKESVERDGLSFVPVLEDPSSSVRDNLLCEGAGTGQDVMLNQRMLRFGDVKYIFNAGMEEELYNLADDPHELFNLAASGDSQQLRGARDCMFDTMKETGDPLAEVYRHLMYRNGFRRTSSS